jgi:hypothetical protein
MNILVKHSVRFLILGLVQVLLLNQLEIGLGIQAMVYPLFILLLPIDLGTIPLLIFAFIFGISIDAISNTFGLHASSLMVFAYCRPLFLKVFAPRDGYENVKEGNTYEMGLSWFLWVYGGLLLVHHFWFFYMEVFRIDEIVFVLQKTFLSALVSFFMAFILQILLVTKPR